MSRGEKKHILEMNSPPNYEGIYSYNVHNVSQKNDW